MHLSFFSRKVSSTCSMLHVAYTMLIVVGLSFIVVIPETQRRVRGCLGETLVPQFDWSFFIAAADVDEPHSPLSLCC